MGSFAQQVSVDFEGLTSAGLFLIEGPTGSGKSTILDAIVYALYGSVAGSASDLGRLDSHMRSESPWVELEFEVSGTTYLVRRSPAHERAKKRGDGTTSVNATASLMVLTPDGLQELATRASDVAEQVQGIIGLNKQQFVSTVVLAQGSSRTSWMPGPVSVPRSWNESSVLSSTSASRSSYRSCAGVPAPAAAMLTTRSPTWSNSAKACWRSNSTRRTRSVPWTPRCWR